MKIRLIWLLLGIVSLSGCQITLFNRPVPREEYLNQLIHAHEGNPHAQFLRAKRFLDQGKGKNAEKSLKEALKIEPNRVEFYLGLGIANEEQQKHSAAKKAYEKALEIDPASSQAEIRLGRLAWRTGHIDEARQWADRASRHDDSSDLWQLRGEINYISLKYPEALTDWKKSLEKSPDQPILQELVTDLSGFLSGPSEKRPK